MDREYIKMENILEIYNNQLRSLYEDDNGNQGKIFKNKNELIEITKKGEEYKNLSNYIENDKRNRKSGKKKRKSDSDKIFIKIKGKVISSFIKALNSYKEFKKERIKRIGKKLINKETSGDFNLDLLQIPLIQILYNNKENRERIGKIIKGNNKGERNSIITILNLKFQNCLDIFRYKEEIEGISDKLNYKLVNFLEKEYEEQKMEINEIDPKEYIALLLLAVYNYENILKKRKMNNK